MFTFLALYLIKRLKLNRYCDVLTKRKLSLFVLKIVNVV